MIEEFGEQGNNEWIILKNYTKIHKTAIVEPWVRFDSACVVHPYAVLGKIPGYNSSIARVPTASKILTIGRNAIIGCHVIVYRDVVLGDDCFLGDYASIREGSRIGDLCVIGRMVTINYNVRMGNRNRFQDGTHITGDCVIGDDNFFGVGVITSNDRSVDLESYHFPYPPQPPIFGSKILIGSGANVLAGVKVGDRATIGAGSMVTKDVEADSLVMGLAAKPRVCDAQLVFENCTK